MKHFILATAGHVDHGKTALVQALTGVDTDRLPEEKARGITIDLGFAHLALPGLSIGLIDVPGHENFVRNMITGVGAVDLALVVVAADDGWMPQTEEHLQILNYLGVKHAVFALTKADLGGTDARRQEIRVQLRETSFANAPIVETSVRSQTGIAELKATLTREFEKLPAVRDLGKPRLFVDRVFSVRGTGTVVTGTLSGGRFARGATVALQPADLSARIRALQSHKQPLEIAEPRTRVALNLAELSPEQIARGATITVPDAGESSRLVDVLLERSARLPATARPIRNGTSLDFHYGGRRLPARLQLLDRKEFLPNETAIARLRFPAPIFVFIGDRFILRDSSEQLTLAGGLVLDPEPGENKFRSTPQRELLASRAVAPNDCVILVRTQLRRDRFAARAGLLRKANFSEEEIAPALEVLCAAGQVFLGDKIAADAGWWRSLREAAAQAIDAEHAAHPAQRGLELTRLRKALGLTNTDVFEALLHSLAEEGFAQSRNMIGRAAHRPSLPPDLRAAGERLRAALHAKPLDPPSRREIASDAPTQQALRFLCENGELILLSDEVVISAEGFEKLKIVIAQHLQGGKMATVSELRQVSGTTRRVIVPLLERLDRLGLTTREGDRRRLR